MNQINKKGLLGIDTRKSGGDDSLDEALVSILGNINPDVANMQLPSPILRDYYRDEANRVLWINDKVDDATLEVAMKILQYNRDDAGKPVEKRQPIKIFINTEGGSVQVMWTIMRIIQISKTPVWTINWCMAMSAGSQILMAGHKRFVMPGATTLIHSGSCVYGGTQEQADSAKKYFDNLTKKTDEFILKTTKIDSKLLKKKAPFDWYITDTEAVDLGIVDKIVDDLDELFA